MLKKILQTNLLITVKITQEIAPSYSGFME